MKRTGWDSEKARPKFKNQEPPADSELKGLPQDLQAEKLVLGSVMLDYEKHWLDVVAALVEDDFSIQKHRTIFRRIVGLADRGEKIDKVTVSRELRKFSEDEACGGLAYFSELNEGLPDLPHVDAYVRIVKDCSSLRRVIFAAQHTINRAMMAEETPEDVLAGLRETTIEIENGRTSDRYQPMTAAKIIDATDGGFNGYLSPERKQKGLPTGFTKLDEFTGGFHPGDLFILAARPSMGKTAMAMNIAQTVAISRRRGTAIFSLEMSRESLIERMLCSVARVDSQRFRGGYVTADERKKLHAALVSIYEAPLYIDDTPGLTLDSLHAKLRRLRDVDLAIVDYLQLMKSPKAENRNQEVSALSRGLKLIAKDCNIPMLVLSQLSRSVETRSGDHRPQLTDLRESGTIEQDADLVGFIFREEVYNRDREDLKGLAELILAKQRSGPVGTVNLVWLAAQTKFENRAEDTGEMVGD